MTKITKYSAIDGQHRIATMRKYPSLLGGNVWDNIFTSIFDNTDSLIRRSTEGYPVTDIYRDENGNSIIECALAGFSKDQLTIEVKDGSITISAKGGTDEETSSRRIAKRSFTKTFVDHNGELDLTSAEANFENGLLRVTIPQTPESQPKTIAIE